MLLLHGWPDSSALGRAQVPALTGAGYRVTTPDLRGFGRSGRPADVASYRMANAVADVAWYMLFFQFAEIAEATLSYADWAALRELTPGYLDIDRAIANLSRPGALTASLNWYRANAAPRRPGPPRQWPPISAPTLGVWSDGDRYRGQPLDSP